MRKKIISIHQPVFLPWLGFFEKMLSSHIFVILDHVQFTKGQYDNRVQIKYHNRAQWITIPVLNKNKSCQKFLDVKIDNSSRWQQHHLGILTQAYHKSNYYKDYWIDFQNIYRKPWQYLIDINLSLINWISGLLSISTPIQYSSQFSEDLGRGSTLNMNIVKILNGNTYYAGAMGISYLDVHEFQQNNICLLHQRGKYPSYIQQGDSFLQGLSIIDCLFNCGHTHTRAIIKAAKLAH